MLNAESHVCDFILQFPQSFGFDIFFFIHFISRPVICFLNREPVTKSLDESISQSCIFDGEHDSLDPRPNFSLAFLISAPTQ